MSRIFLNAKGRIYHLQDCGHLVRSDLQVCPTCEPLSLSFGDIEACGLVEQCPDTEPAPAKPSGHDDPLDQERDLQELLDSLAETGEMP